MANQYINAMTDLWNSAGTVYSAIKMNVTNAASSATSKLFHLQVGSVDKFYVDKNGAVVAAGTLTSSGVVSSGGTVPSANDAAALGASGTAWSDLFLASGGVINWDAADVTITHSADLLAFAGATSGYSFDYCIKPAANDGTSLGVSGTAFSDLFLATGAVVNYGAGNAVLTHSAGVLTVAPGDLRITTAGSDATSAVTVGGTQTLTGKTLTVPTLTSPNISQPIIIGAPNAAGATWTNLGAVTTADINGGTIDGTIIGATAPAAITGTTVTGSSGSFSTVAASTSMTAPAATFTTSVTGGTVKSGQNFESTSTAAVLSPAAGLNTIYLRPRGQADAYGQTTINSDGVLTAGNSIVASGNFHGSNLYLAGGIDAQGGATFRTAVFVRAASGNVHLWFQGPNGEDRGVIYTDSGSAGDLNFRNSVGHQFTLSTNGAFYGSIGYRCKVGVNGGYTGNTYNWYWGSGYLDVYIDATPFRVITPSDYRTKKDVEPLPSTWAKVKALRPVSYLPSSYVMLTGVEATELPEGAPKAVARSTFSTDDGEQWSLIAHEVQEALIHSAAHGEKDIVNGLQTLNLNAIVAALTKALQEAMARIEVLEAKVGA